MAQFILTRLLRALMTLFIIVTFAFFVMRLSGDPLSRFFDVATTPPEVIEAFRRQWGLDQPIWVQFYKYLGAVFHGDLGNSMRENRPALDVVLDRLPATLAIMAPTLVLKTALGLLAGITAALHRNSVFDRLIMSISVLGFTVPTFVLALVLALVFAVQLRWLPSGGYATPLHMVLPIVTLSIAGSAVIARYARSAMVEVLGQPFVRTARAKGVPWTKIISRHVLPNAAVPIVTIFGFMLGSMVSGAVVVESVFSWPGIGRLLISSVTSRDLAVVQVILLLIGAMMVISNFIVDLLYGVIDPRMRGPRQAET
ncbi:MULTISPECIES: ABC transporter permease [unclassified Rhizobium]|jgi:peptide/nickel transport system permease protein|uniref:ABC transporter permease n=1 Tax=unclassified Rhizobium TaxID=2613769 RepID=UPI0006473EEA|nr:MULTISPECIES: ABC transporter permease [unclassified Rhizobium]OJY78605.1 MAG: ABC transporter permease [Rhizobium sp. 60-20]RKD35882.1 peptide/nickel transport system permease protein [Rhizobium sp. WW_1]